MRFTLRTGKAPKASLRGAELPQLRTVNGIGLHSPKPMTGLVNRARHQGNCELTVFPTGGREVEEELALEERLRAPPAPARIAGVPTERELPRAEHNPPTTRHIVDGQVAPAALPDDAPIDGLIHDEQLAFGHAWPQLLDLAGVRLPLLLHVERDEHASIPKREVETIEGRGVILEFLNARVTPEYLGDKLLARPGITKITFPIFGPARTRHARRLRPGGRGSRKPCCGTRRWRRRE